MATRADEHHVTAPGFAGEVDADTSVAQATPRRVDAFRHGDEATLDTAVGRSIGYEFARLGLKLPEGAAQALREGYAEGANRWSHARVESTPWERKLLRLKASAWRRNRFVDEAVTPAYLQAIQVRYCPITRIPLTSGTGTDTDATVDRVFNGGAYAIGNLAMMSARANHAKANLMPDELYREAMSGSSAEGLSNAEWMRLAAMTCAAAPPGYMEQLHLPMLVFPPNGLLVSNAFVVLQMTFSSLAVGWVRKRAITEFRDCCVGKKRKQAFVDMLGALCAAIARKTRAISDPELYRFGICDAWLEPLIFESYASVMRGASKAEVLNMVQVARKEQDSLHAMSREALASWAVETRGYAS